MRREQIRRFSLRKLSVGLVSMAVGSVFLAFSGQTALASEEKKEVSYRYVSEDELTDEEKRWIVGEVPRVVSAKDNTYYLVYRSNKVGATLPYTGTQDALSPLIAGASILFLVVCVAIGKDKKKKVTSILLITTLGSTLISPSALAISNRVLAQYNQTLNLSVGDKLPAPLKIANYHYVGYVRLEKDNRSDEKQKDNHDEQSKQIEGPSDKLEKPKAPDTPDKPSQPEVPKVPDTSGKPSQPEKPKVPDTPDKPSQPEVPKVPDTTDKPSQPEKPKVPDTPDKPKQPEVPKIPDTSGKPSQPEKPKVPDTPEKPEQPEKPKVPDTSGKPSQPEKPKVPDTSDKPKQPESPKEPDTSGKPSQPEKPKVPDTSDKPKQPESPKEPNAPEEPKVPENPKMPDKPDEPNQPGTPNQPDEPAKPNKPVEPAPPVQPQLETTIETVPFTTVYQADHNLAYGQRRVEQTGVAGAKEIVINKDTRAIVSEKVTKAPVNEIVKVGVKTNIVTENIPFTTEIKLDDTLEKGTETEVMAGKNGTKTITTTYTLDTKTGVVTVNPSTVTVVPAVKRVVKQGIKETTIEPISFTTIYQADNNLAYGERKTTKEGVNGEKEIVRNTQTNTIKSTTVKKEPVARIITVGTKPTVQKTIIPFKEIRQPDATLLKGQEVVEVDGKNGERTTTTTYKLDEKTGVVTPNTPTVVETPATDKVIKVGDKVIKAKPDIALDTVTKDVDKKQITVKYLVTDKDNALVSAKAQIYKGDTLVKEVPIPDVSKPLTIGGLDYYTDYTLKTVATYNVGNGNQDEVQKDIENFRLDYKKIEFKDIQSVELYENVNNEAQLRASLNTVPNNVSSFYAKIKPSQSKDMIVPVASIKEVTKDGQSVYQVSVDLPELVQDTNGTYSQQYNFYVPKGSGNAVNNAYYVDYDKVQGAEKGRSTAYSNMEKLMPFYNKEYIVHMGNKINTTDKLYQKDLIDVVPMIDNKIVTDINSNKAAINRLMLHYDDKTVSYVPLKYKENFKNDKVVEYDITGTGLIYTPEVFVKNNDNVVNQILPTLSAVEFNSEQVRKTLGIENDNSKNLADLYLEKTFNAVKKDLVQELKKVLSSDKAINTLGEAETNVIVKQIKDNAEAFMLGLSYLNRWYDINYGDINIKDLSAYKLDFFDNVRASTIDHIIEVGRAGFDVLKASNNVEAFRQKIAQTKRKADVFSYLEAYRELFLPNKTNNEWLKENTKAYLVEAKSGVKEAAEKQDVAYGKKNNNQSVGIYDRITHAAWSHRNMLLPLLTAKEENTYIISTMATLSFGSYERYTTLTQLKGDEFKAYMRKQVDETATWQRDYFDFWYKMLDENSKEKLFRSLLTYDGFYLADSTGKTDWRTLHDDIPSLQDFFGPVGYWYQKSAAAAYATGTVTHFSSYRILDRVGTSTFTHESTHNFDGNAYFEGNGRREGLGAELFAKGLLQVPAWQNSAYLGINMAFPGEVEAKDRYHAAKPAERYQSVNDVNEYIHRMFDVLYTLEYAESQSMLKQSDKVKKQWYRMIENVLVNNTHAANKIRRLTDDEVAKLKTLDDLIKHNILDRRSYADESTFKRNGYYTIPLFSANYAALSNPNGAPGDVMFKRMAYELWAAKGFKDGFIPYVSNKYASEAAKEGDTTWSSWYRMNVGNVKDSRVLKNVFQGQYATWEEFKKAMYQERIAKFAKLKPVTITYEVGVQNSTKEVTISSFEQLQQLMDEAVAKDATDIDNSYKSTGWASQLMSKVYNAYLRSTDDFKQSIFKD